MKKKSKKDEIVKRREAEGFLPKYSERYFAGKGKSRLIWGFICAFIGIEAFSRGGGESVLFRRMEHGGIF